MAIWNLHLYSEAYLQGQPVADWKVFSFHHCLTYCFKTIISRKKLAKLNAHMIGNMTFSETVKQPLQEPTITTCSVMLERKAKTAGKKSRPGSPSKKSIADSNERLG